MTPKPKIISPLRRATAVALVLLFLPVPQLVAQISGISAAQAGAPKSLHIVILDGEDALNNIRQRTAREPIVQVEDENHKPVAAAAVTFTIHSGPSGAAATFAGVTTFAAITGLDGQATTKGLQPNNIRGNYTITVEASAGGVTTSAVITQTNVITTASTTSTGSHAAIAGHHVGIFTGHFWLIAGGIAAAGGAIVTTIVLTHTNGATITPGTGTVKP